MQPTTAALRKAKEERQKAAEPAAEPAAELSLFWLQVSRQQ
jgi:hypothetical protein